MNTRILAIKLYVATRECMEQSGIALPRFGELPQATMDAWVAEAQAIISSPRLVPEEVRRYV